jgi:hypothetical protein
MDSSKRCTAAVTVIRAEGLVETRAILRFARIETSEAPYEGALQVQSSKISWASVRKQMVLSIHPQEMHGSYTGFAQVEFQLLYRRDWPSFLAFDLLEVDGEDLRDQPLAARKRRLRQIMPSVDSRLLYVDHLERRGSALFRAACARDLEGIVAKWRHGRYFRTPNARAISSSSEPLS